MAEAIDLLCSLRLEDGRPWGEAALPWQRADADAVLKQDGPRLHYQCRPRGASKTGDAAALLIAALVGEQLPPRSRSYLAAADRDQAALALDSIGGYVARTPGLASALRVETWKVTANRTGATCEVLASDESSSWGLRPAMLIADELSSWRETSGPRRFWTSLYSALPKVPGSRLLVLTTAGAPGSAAHKLLVRARASAQWRVSELEGPTPWLSSADLDEQRAALAPWEFERLHLNRWTESADRLVAGGDLDACITLDGAREWRRHEPASYCLAVDVGLVNDRTVLAVCSRVHGSDVVALDNMTVWQGSRAQPVSLEAVEAAIVEAWEHYHRPPLVLDPWQGALLAQRLRRRGLRVVEHPFTATSVSKLALRLHGAIRDQALALPDDPELLDELRNVRLRETSPGVYRLDHDHGRHDDRAIALALAADHLLARPAPGRPDGARSGGRGVGDDLARALNATPLSTGMGF